MKSLLIGLALTLSVPPSWAQTADQTACASNNPDIGIPACTTEIQSDQGDPTSEAIDYFNRGRLYHLKGLQDQAIAEDTKAIALKPDYDHAYYNRALSYHMNGEDTQGLPDAEKAVALNPSADHIDMRAEIYEKLGERSKAVADYQVVLKLAPGTQDALDGLKRLGVATTETASDRIEASYNTAFCRPPRPEEMEFWRGDPRSASEDALIAAHRVWLRNTTSDRQAIIVLSYHTIFNRDPQPAELAYWDDRVAHSGETCSELLAAHRQWKEQNPDGH